MKTTIFLPMLVLLAACHKDDVEIGNLTSNPMDPAWTGSSFIIIGAITTEETIPGSGLIEQQVPVSVNVDRFPVTNEYVVRIIEQVQGDTAFFHSVDEPTDSFVHENYQLTEGVEYCYRIDLIIDGGVALGHRVDVCETAQL